MESQGYLGILHSNPLGVMCQSFFRCIAACLSIADPDLVDGAAIFLLWGMRPLRENPLRAAGQSCRHRNPWTDDSKSAQGRAGPVAAPRRRHGTFKSVRLPTASLASRQLQRGQVRQGAASIFPPALQPVESGARHGQASFLHGCAAAPICPKACRRNDRPHDS